MGRGLDRTDGDDGSGVDDDPKRDNQRLNNKDKGGGGNCRKPRLNRRDGDDGGGGDDGQGYRQRTKSDEDAGGDGRRAEPNE